MRNKYAQSCYMFFVCWIIVVWCWYLHQQKMQFWYHKLRLDCWSDKNKTFKRRLPSALRKCDDFSVFNRLIEIKWTIYKCSSCRFFCNCVYFCNFSMCVSFGASYPLSYTFISVAKHLTDSIAFRSRCVIKARLSEISLDAFLIPRQCGVPPRWFGTARRTSDM